MAQLSQLSGCHCLRRPDCSGLARGDWGVGAQLCWAFRSCAGLRPQPTDLGWVQAAQLSWRITREHMRAKVTTASFSPDSTRLVTGSEDCCGRVWDVLLAWLVQLVGGPSAQLWVVSRLSQQLGGEWKMCCHALGPWGLKLSFQAPVGSSPMPMQSHARIHCNFSSGTVSCWIMLSCSWVTIVILEKER